MKPITKALSITLLAAASALAFAPTASAGELDRDSDTQTAWLWYYNQTPTQINARRSAGYRIVSLDVDLTSPLRFSAAFVRNTGSYARSSSTWYYGTPSFVESRRAGRRITSLTPYVVNNRLYLAASMVANTGSNAKAWAYYYGSLSYISGRVSAFGGRIVDLDSYVIGSTRYYSALMVKNTGTDARSWWWYVNATPSTIASRLSANRARLIDIESVGSGRYNCVMSRDRTPTHGWWYYNVNISTLNDRIAQNGARLISLQRTGSTFHACMINNSNALTTRIGDILRTSTGRGGLYLKQIGGSVRAALRSNEIYEPASTMKTLIHVHAMRRVMQGTDRLTNLVRSWQGDKNACPTTSAPTKNERLDTVLRGMMEQSHNYNTMSAELRYGRANINATARALGMSRTEIRHRLGCGPGTNLANKNRLTLEDIGRLHEQVAAGYLGSQRNTFYNLMLQGNYNAIVDVEAAKLKLHPAVIAKFKSFVARAHKGGSYNFGGRAYRGAAGWFRLPWCISNRVVLREYVVGVYVDSATNSTKASNASGLAWGEIVRDEIRAALRTWINARADGSAVAFGKGCNGSNGVVTHFSTGTPEIGQVQTFQVSRGPRSSVAILNIGFSRTSWASLRLPFPLDFLGATGCSIYTPPTITFAKPTTSTGTFALSLRHPNVNSLVGARFYTQVTCLDKGGNRFGLTYSNGLQSTLGGLRK